MKNSKGKSEPPREWHGTRQRDLNDRKPECECVRKE
nr:MAG TPA: hypothetical protein [Caudoviricetes sp.]